MEKSSASTFQTLTSGFRDGISGVGRYVLMLKATFLWVFKPPLRLRLIFRQLEFVGNKSLSIVFLSSIFTGAVLGLQTGNIFKIFGAEGMLGGATGKAMAVELAPVMCGLIVTGRAGAAMAAELATMRVNEQIDAMEAMGVDPVSYLIVPRVVASVMMMPLLSLLFLFLGVVGSYIVGIVQFNIDSSVFFEKLQWLVYRSDIFKGMFKAGCFGFVFATVACFKGFHARGGAKGVGEATTQAVVVSFVTLLVLDFFISLLQVKL